MRGKKAILCIGYIIVATICIVSIALLFFSRNKNESEKSKRTIGALYMTMNNLVLCQDLVQVKMRFSPS